MNHYGLIMAGGGGTRFWPLSRSGTPKQLLNLSGRDLMINETVDRMSMIIGKSNLFIITAEMQAPSMILATQCRVFPENILMEPVGRNTAACIAYSAMKISALYGDGIMVITPSDQYIRDDVKYAETLRKSVNIAEEHDKLITVGIKPTFPATGYGYIGYADAPAEIAKPVLEFREKPDEAVAEEYIRQGHYVWNSGMFIWKASLILRKIQQYVPDIYEKLAQIQKVMNTPAEQDVLHRLYPEIRNISIDYAVMEPSAREGDVLVIPSEFGWSDVGSWDMMDVLHTPDENGNVLIGDTVAVNTSNSIVYSASRTVTAVDVDGLVIVETPDAVMVCPKDRAQDVKKIAEELKKTGRKELL